MHDATDTGTDSAIEIKNFFWAPLPGGKKERGIRIQRGRGWVFVPNARVFELADRLIDHMEEQNR